MAMIVDTRVPHATLIRSETLVALRHCFGEAEPRQLLQAACSHALFHAVPMRRPDQATLVGRGDQPSIYAGQPLLFHLVQARAHDLPIGRSEEHTSELQSLMRISYAVFCLKKKT